MKTTPRQRYWKHLHQIQKINGFLFRRLTYAEARCWLIAYRAERTTGYDHEDARIRAWDCYHAARNGGLGRRWL